MSARHYKTRLLTDACYNESLRCRDLAFKVAGIVGGTTTDELRSMIRRMGEHPDFLVRYTMQMRARCAAAVERADFLRANLRKHHPGIIPDVTVERQWLAIADELVARAEAAVEFWRISGGERALELARQRAAGTTSGSPGAAVAPVIELNPTFNIEITQGADGKPLDVRVIGLPVRERVTEIERDDDGEIVGSKQVERDAA